MGIKLFPVFIETAWRSLILWSCSFYNRRSIHFTVILSVMIFAFKSNSTSAFDITIPIRTINFNTDPQSMEDVSSLMINRQLYRGLMKYTSELELIKDLAESYEIIDSGKVYRFKLGNSKFSDGTIINAYDVVSTFKRMLKLKSAIVADLQSIDGFSLQKIDITGEFGVKALSDKIVEFKLEFADPFFIKNIAAVDCSILKLNDKLKMLPITSGRYSLNQTKDSVSLKLINPKENLKAPQAIHLVKIETDAAAVSMARKGLIDTLEAFQVTEDERRELEMQGWKSFKGQIAKLLMFSLNPKTMNLELRTSIFTIFNQRIKDSFNEEHYSPSFGLIPNLLPGHLTQAETVTLNGKINNNLKNKVITIAYPDIFELKLIAEWAQKLLEKEKFKIKIKSFPLAAYFDVIKEKKYEIVLRSKYLDYPDGMAFLTYFKSDLPINTFDAGSKDIDKLISQAQREVNNSTRISSYKKIQYNLLKGYTLIPLFTGSTQSALWFTKKVSSIPAHPMGFHSLYFHEIAIVE